MNVCVCVFACVCVFVCTIAHMCVCLCVHACGVWSVSVCVLSCVCLSAQGMFFYYLLGFIWVTQFIAGCERLTVSGAVALWFFTR